MAKITDDIKFKILADWKVGYSQNQLAKNYNVSPATINKICKGIEQDNINLVNSQVSVITALKDKSEYEVNSIDKKVNEEVRHRNLVYSIQEKLLNKIKNMAEQIESPSDAKILIEAVDKASITLKVSERHAPKTDVNLQSNQVNQPTKIVISRDN